MYINTAIGVASLLQMLVKYFVQLCFTILWLHLTCILATDAHTLFFPWLKLAKARTECSVTLYIHLRLSIYVSQFNLYQSKTVMWFESQEWKSKDGFESVGFRLTLVQIWSCLLQDETCIPSTSYRRDNSLL